MKLPPLIRTLDFNCDLKMHWFLVTAWGGCGPERTLSNCHELCFNFLHNRCNSSDAFSAIKVSFSQIFKDFSEDEMEVFETKEPSSVSAQIATIVQPQKE